MNKIKYLIFSAIIFTLTFSYANAECTTEELSSLRQDADKVKVTYKHLGTEVNEDGIVIDNMFDITFKNLTDDMYLRIDKFDEEWTEKNENGLIIFQIATGKYKFSIYSKKCQERITDINVKIPRFNSYSLDPLCDGIDESDFPLCGKYYEYEISYDNFKTRVEDYRKKNKIDKNDNNDASKEKFSINTILSRILDFIDEYQLCLLISLIVILLILIIIIVIRRKKKRGVLE